MRYLFTLTTIARTAHEEFRYTIDRCNLAAKFVWSVVSHPAAIRMYAAIGRALLNLLIFVAAVLWLAKTKLDAYVEFCEQPAAVEAEPIDLVAAAIDTAVTAAAIVWVAAESGWAVVRPDVERAIGFGRVTAVWRRVGWIWKLRRIDRCLN